MFSEETYFDYYITLTLKALIAELPEEKKKKSQFVQKFLILQDKRFDICQKILSEGARPA
jgi:hypothetical protein